MARPRLTDALQGTRVGVVEAGAGYGKSALAVEFGDVLESPLALGRVTADHSDAHHFIGSIAEGLTAAGLTDLAVSLSVPGRPPQHALTALLEGLARRKQPVLTVVDDAHHLDETGADLLAAVVERLPTPHRLLILARRLPTTTPPTVPVLTASDLAFNLDEIVAVCAGVAGMSLGGDVAARLLAVTGGWPAAVVLAAARMARDEDPAAVVAGMEIGPGLIDGMIEDLLAGFDTEQSEAVTQFAHLPLLGPQLGPATGFPDVFERTADAGLPYTSARRGWHDLPAPVREHLKARAPLRPEVARAASRIYQRRGELPAAIGVLLAAGQDEAAAAEVAEWPASRLAGIEPGRMRRFVESLPTRVVDAQPRLLIHLARAHDAASDYTACRASLNRARALLDGTGDPAIAREAEAELARDLARHGEIGDAARLAEAVLDSASANELVARARAHATLGRVGALDGGLPSALRAAVRHFEEAARLSIEAGMPDWAATDLSALAFYVYSERGRDHDALEALDRAVDLAQHPGPTRANALSFRAITLQYLGRFDEAQADLDESRAIAEVYGDDRLQAYAFWQDAVGAGRQGDADRVRRGLRAAERLRGDWFDHPTGLEFLAEAAEAADLAEDHALSAQYALRARDRIAGQAEPSAGFAETLLALTEARSGDPAAGLTALENLDPEDVPDRERWRVALLQGYAAWRLADPRAGGLAARGFDLADDMGNPGLPFAQERTAAEALVALAAEAGSSAARGRANADVATRISVLGRLEVTRGGRPVEIPSGRPAQIVEVLACAGGRIPTEELLEAIWPDADPDSSRKALRNGLNRLRAAAGELVVRDGEMLSFGERVTVDAVVFEELGERALAARSAGGVAAAGLASRALAHYWADLLPDDPYEPWAAETRERLRLLRLRLLDLLATVAEERGEVDEAVTRLREAIDLSPYDEHRYLRAARLLVGAGHYGEAATVARRSVAMLADLDVAPSPELAELLDRFSNTAG